MVAEQLNQLSLGGLGFHWGGHSWLVLHLGLSGWRCLLQLLLQKVAPAIGSCFDCWPGRRSRAGVGLETSTGTVSSNRLMQSAGSGEHEVESVTLRLANLEITVTARVVNSPAATTPEVSVVGVVSPESDVQAARDPEGFVDPFNISVELEEQSLAATSARLLGELPVPFLAPSVARLRGTDTVWNPRCRIARAFRAGVIARRRLDGQVLDHSSQNIPYRNTYYIVLRGIGNSAGFWTCNFGVYIAGVAEQNGRNSLHPDTISHGFPTHAESAAYLCGARRSWPRER